MIMTEFITDLPDIPRIITAMAEWLACFVYILPMRKTGCIGKGAFATVSAGFLVVQCVFMVATDRFDGIAWNLCMAGAVLLMFCYIRICTRTTLNNAVCGCCTAFIASEFAASVEWQIWCYVHDIVGLHGIIWKMVILTVVYGVVFFFIWELISNI